MSFSRRQFLAGTGSAGLTALGATIPFELVLAQGAPIKLGSILDNSGNLDAYGKPMVMATAAPGILLRKRCFETSTEMNMIKPTTRKATINSFFANSLRMKSMNDFIRMNLKDQFSFEAWKAMVSTRNKAG